MNNLQRVLTGLGLMILLAAAYNQLIPYTSNMQRVEVNVPCDGGAGSSGFCAVGSGKPLPVTGTFSAGASPLYAACDAGSGLCAVNGTSPLPVENYLNSPSGTPVLGSGTAKGVKKSTQDGMCFTKTGCVEVDSAAIGQVTGTAVVTANTWYEVTTQGDSSALTWASCWDDVAAIPAFSCSPADAGCVLDAGALCYARPKLKDGSIKAMAFFPTVPGADAGSGGSTATIYFWALTASGQAVTFCPEVPCN